MTRFEIQDTLYLSSFTYKVVHLLDYEPMALQNTTVPVPFLS